MAGGDGKGEDVNHSGTEGTSVFCFHGNGKIWGLKLPNKY
jgi:hypothetical protein